MTAPAQRRSYGLSNVKMLSARLPVCVIGRRLLRGGAFPGTMAEVLDAASDATTRTNAGSGGAPTVTAQVVPTGAEVARNASGTQRTAETADADVAAGAGAGAGAGSAAGARSGGTPTRGGWDAKDKGEERPWGTDRDLRNAAWEAYYRGVRPPCCQCSRSLVACRRWVRCGARKHAGTYTDRQHSRDPTACALRRRW